MDVGAIEGMVFDFTHGMLCLRRIQKSLKSKSIEADENET